MLTSSVPSTFYPQPLHLPTTPMVLLAEDDRSVRHYLETLLKRAGYAVTSVSDGLEAMKAAMSTPVDVVITDAIMPHLSGYELCRFLRRHPKLKDVPVVLLSGIDHAAQSQEVEANVHLAKPVRPDELINCLKDLLTHECPQVG